MVPKPDTADKKFPVKLGWNWNWFHPATYDVHTALVPTYAVVPDMPLENRAW